MKSKSNMAFSIDKKIGDEFNEYCEEMSINKSKLVNKILRDFLENEKLDNEKIRRREK